MKSELSATLLKCHVKSYTAHKAGFDLFPPTTQSALTTMSGEEETTDVASNQKGIDNTEESLMAPAFSFAQEDTVVLVVGPEKKSLVAHESHLNLNTDFFKTALKKEWVEGQTRVINLPGDDTETVTSYLTFTYGSGLPTATLKAVPAGGPGPKSWISLVKLYILGERLLDTSLRNAVIKEIARMSSLADGKGVTYFMGRSISSMCYDGTPTGSPLRRMVVDKHISAGRQDWISHEQDHPVFLAELSQALLAKVAARQPYAEFVCRQLKAEDYLI